MPPVKQALDHISVDDYFDVLARWLDLEAVAERERMARRRQLRNRHDAERTGETILGLQLQDHQTGLAGRFLFDFSKSGNQPLPMNRLKVGSPVVLSDADRPDDKGIAGVVSRRKQNMIQIATEVWPEGRFFRLDLSPDETTRRRQLAAMARARVATGRAKQLRDTLLNRRAVRQCDPGQAEFLTELNPPQQDAVRFALTAPDIAILHGPPGTGKTTTLAEVIYQAVKNGTPHLPTISPILSSSTFAFKSPITTTFFPPSDSLNSSFSSFKNFSLSSFPFVLRFTGTHTDTKAYFVNPILHFTHTILENFLSYPVTFFHTLSDIRIAHPSTISLINTRPNHSTLQTLPHPTTTFISTPYYYSLSRQMHLTQY